MLDSSQLTSIIEAIIQAHADTNVTYPNRPPILGDFMCCKNQPELLNLFNRGLLSILNETKFLEYFNALIENAVLFAKNVPYFMNIHETDRITLLKSCVFEIICVRHAQCYSNALHDSPTGLATLAACAVAASTNTILNNSFDLLYIPQNDTWATPTWLSDKLPQLKHFIYLLFDFYRYFSTMNLDDNEIAMFSSYLLFNSGKKFKLFHSKNQF